MSEHKPWDEVGFIMAFEGGELTEEALIDGFQHLVDNGHAWSLQGVYGRTAAALIQRGLVKDTHHWLSEHRPDMMPAPRRRAIPAE